MRAHLYMLSGLLMIAGTGLACDSGSDDAHGRDIVCDGFSLTGCEPWNDDGGGVVDDPAGELCGYRTELQGNWGSSCQKSALGKLRDAYFADLFPEGLYFGCGEFTGNLLTSAAVHEALPSVGEPRALFKTEAVAYDGVDDPAVGTVLFGEVVALSLNIAFADVKGFNPLTPVPFAELRIVDPESPCLGLSVQEVLDEANLTLGGCLATLTPAQATECAAAINASFDANDGKCKGGNNNNSLPGDDDAKPKDEACSDLFGLPIQ